MGCSGGARSAGGYRGMIEKKHVDISSLDIDFLPAKYRELSVQRKIQNWRMLVCASFVALLACAAMIQMRTDRSLRHQLATIGPEHEIAEALSARLAQLQSESMEELARAELITYLRHPWPRTQILSRVLSQLPESIQLGELRVDEDESVFSPVVAIDSVSSDANPPAEREKARGAKKDLETLRTEYDKRTAVVTLSGDTRDVSALHDYLSQIAKDDIVAKTELLSIERKRIEDGERIQFRVRITLRIEYGQPGGPREHPKSTKSGNA